MSVKFIAVYGTLRKGQGNHHLIKHLPLVATLRLSGIASYDLGPFPVAKITKEESDVTVVEVYAIADTDVATMEAVDRLEGYKEGDDLANCLYRRVEITVPDYGKMSLYEYLGDVNELQRITDWVAEKYVPMKNDELDFQFVIS